MLWHIHNVELTNDTLTDKFALVWILIIPVEEVRLEYIHVDHASSVVEIG